MLLPEAAALNVNTASKEVLAAVADMDVGSAGSLIQRRQGSPYKDADDFKKQAALSMQNQARIDVRSVYFEVRARLRLNDQVLIERSLVRWQQRPAPPIVLRRERVASLEQAGG